MPFFQVLQKWNPALPHDIIVFFCARLRLRLTSR
jgi:hypothetical protein